MTAAPNGGRQAALSDALAKALKARNVSELQAVLAARVGIAAFSHATITWLEQEGMGLAERLDLAERELKALL